MYNPYNLEANTIENWIAVFKKYLIAEKISPGSIRSYLSDTKHFLGWLTLFLQNNGFSRIASRFTQIHETGSNPCESASYPCESGLLKFVNERLLTAYKDYLTSNNVPLKTINRRFSSLRKFGAFCQSQNWLPHNYFDTLKTIMIDRPFPENEWHLGEFRVNLWKNNAAKLTIKNYLNDIKQFIGWYSKFNNSKAKN